MEDPEAPAWDVNVLSRHTQSIIDNEKMFQKDTIGNATDIVTALGEAMKMAGPQCNEKAAKLREIMKQVLGVNAEVTAHTEALSEVKRQLQPRAELMDFATELDAKMKVYLANAGCTGEADALLREFDSKVTAAGDGAASESDENEDLVMDERSGQPAPNAACPLSGQRIYDIEEPVEDQMGYVYDKKAVEAYIRKGRGQADCPVVGTHHLITLDTLKTARNLIRAQKRRRRQEARQSQMPYGGVLDID